MKSILLFVLGGALLVGCAGNRAADPAVSQMKSDLVAEIGSLMVDEIRNVEAGPVTSTNRGFDAGAPDYSKSSVYEEEPFYPVLPPAVTR